MHRLSMGLLRPPTTGEIVEPTIGPALRSRVRIRSHPRNQPAATPTHPHFIQWPSALGTATQPPPAQGEPGLHASTLTRFAVPLVCPAWAATGRPAESHCVGAHQLNDASELTLQRRHAPEP